MLKFKVAFLAACTVALLGACVADAPSTETTTDANPTPVAALPSNPGGQALALINAQRSSAGIAPVAYSPQLQAAANAHVDWMVSNNTLSHRGAGGRGIKSRVRASGFCAGLVNENIANGQSSPQAVVSTWLGSPPHRRNILMRGVDHGAVGFARDASGTLWWTMMMGEAC
jgi:uncharacterized protein YkwD